MEEVKGSSQGSDVSCDIPKTSYTRSLKAMGWNGISNLLDGEIGKLEFVAICIQQFPVYIFQIQGGV